MTYAKKSLFFLFIFSISFSLFAQSAGETNSGNSGMINESEIFLNLDSADSTNESNGTATTRKKQSSVWPFIKMFLILAVLVAAIYGVLYFVKRNVNKTVDEDEFLRRVAFLNLSPGKSVEVVTLIDHAYLVGVSDAGINLISEINDKELIDAMNLYADKHRNVTKSRNFADVLNLFMPNAPRGNSNIFEGSEQNVSSVLKSQRSKLNNSENSNSGNS